MTDPAFWRGKKVFLTGHTGFKGAWASLLLRRLGASVYGYALPPTHQSALFVTACIADDVKHRLADIRDLPTLRAAMAEAEPDIVIHMAAQALVRPSYEEPVETFATNVMGTVHVLEAARHLRSVQAILIVTTDKCYENNGAGTAFREDDRLGGNDPYSNSKACAELATYSYRHSFFNAEGAARVATARAGNVFGGGDWARDRLVPDAMQAFLAGEALRIRNPNSVRPWQHALDPVLGYLTLVERLADDQRFVGGWNFGPDAASEVSVGTVVDHLITLWGDGAQWTADPGPHPHEAAYLRLDCAKARSELGWRPRLDLAQGLRRTVDWYKALRDGRDLRKFSLDQLDEVVGTAQV
ncbi:CDP-glucose 4,6-dehydratase [Bradyrhizobium sp. CCGB12]|uniref:CDP-glucose 4,6-dehydratase n=1 Tax=Bradyrhizobium sp. CCGB12 TaxID=2949632 RepID=UPI0020B351DC|nr:CDP-glucose 4,6-dehydratase [Bradyrhizobium sp. CCGB12]MCP3388308.1 CDP-glucose 4,6-dehydratase [Bradyrhizobium sp. CCGB12]